jgi:hypothetical protein
LLRCNTSQYHIYSLIAYIYHTMFFSFDKSQVTTIPDTKRISLDIIITPLYRTRQVGD